MSIKFVDTVEERSRSIIKCERSVITMILIRLNYLIYSFDKYTIILSIETSIAQDTPFFRSHMSTTQVQSDLFLFWMEYLLGLHRTPSKVLLFTCRHTSVAQCFNGNHGKNFRIYCAKKLQHILQKFSIVSRVTSLQVFF